MEMDDVLGAAEEYEAPEITEAGSFREDTGHNHAGPVETMGTFPEDIPPPT